MISLNLEGERFAAMIAALLCSLLALTSACSSTPEIPEEEPRDEVSYRSTEEGSAETTSGAEPSPLIRAETGSDTLTASGPVAVVNGEAVTAEQFQGEIQKIIDSGQLPPHVLAQIQGQEREQLKAQLLESMVVRRLIEQAIKANPMEISPEQVDERIVQMEDELRMASQGRMTSIDQMLQQMGMSQEDLNESVRQSLVLEALVRQNYNYQEASEQEAREYYEENLDQFQQPEQVRARHILLKVPSSAEEAEWDKAKKQIDKLHARASAEGADFAAIAKEHSEDGSAEQGGDLGYFTRNVMVPEFEAVVFELADQSVSEPFRSRFGWHIVKREDYKAAGPAPFEAVKQQLVTQLTGLKFQQSLERYVSELQEAATVELKPENIN